jgi:hypothetical protein
MDKVCRFGTEFPELGKAAKTSGFKNFSFQFSGHAINLVVTTNYNSFFESNLE